MDRTPLVITQITAVVVVACESKELGKLLLDGLLVTQNGRLVAHDCVHVCPECVHVLANGNLVLLGLIPVCIELSGQVMNLVL